MIGDDETAATTPKTAKKTRMLQSRNIANTEFTVSIDAGMVPREAISATVSPQLGHAFDAFSRYCELRLTATINRGPRAVGARQP